MSKKPESQETAKPGTSSTEKPDTDTKPAAQPKELGGRSGPEPTRYGDWEKNGIISDF